MNKQKPRVELKAEGRTLGYGRASNMFGCESARMPCSIALFVVVCVLFSQQCPFSSRRLRELKAAAPRSRRQESKRPSPLCWARISKPSTSAGRAGRRASRVLCPELCRRTVVAALARKGQTNKRAPRRALAGFYSAVLLCLNFKTCTDSVYQRAWDTPGFKYSNSQDPTFPARH